MTSMSNKMQAVLFVALFAASVQAQTNPYCSIASCGTRPNTLCTYTTSSIGAACNPLYTKNVTAAEITTIVTKHNALRRRVAKGLETTGSQPSASNMRQMSWDTELAKMAQTHAQQCVFQHDQCRDVPRFYSGQNIYISSSSAQSNVTSWDAAIQSWYNEVVDFTNPAWVSSFPSSTPKVIGHYTQVVWAKSYLVGCGMAYFKDTSAAFASYPYRKIYVCNYGPGGNYLATPVYTTGAPGSLCPTGTTNSDGLCV